MVSSPVMLVVQLEQQQTSRLLRCHFWGHLYLSYYILFERNESSCSLCGCICSRILLIFLSYWLFLYAISILGYYWPEDFSQLLAFFCTLQSFWTIRANSPMNSDPRLIVSCLFDNTGHKQRLLIKLTHNFSQGSTSDSFTAKCPYVLLVRIVR